MIIECKSRDEWLTERNRLVINASDAAAIMGFGAPTISGEPRQTALDVYVSKKVPTDVDNDAMLIGRCLENGISEIYASKTGRVVENPGDYTIFVHDEYPWIGSTLDRVIRLDNPESTGPLELKHAGWMKRREWSDGVPLWLQIQLQLQIQCAKSSWGAFCGIVGGADIHYGDMDRNDRFFESALPVFDEFRWRLENNRPPPVESHRNLDSVKKLFPEDSGETIELGEQDLFLANRRETLKRSNKEIEKEIKEIEAKLKLSMEKATWGKLPDGSILSLTTTKNKGYTKVVDPYMYRTLRRKF
jgi:putative phage-type endonuclease